MSELYPLKFEPVLKKKLWGGTALVNQYFKKADPAAKYGECWEISSVSDNLSVVSNGFLAGNNIQELIEVYMGDITGDSVYEKFGVEFPLLIKLIEAKEDLSIQVHPGNELAKERHSAYGKTEMWYILESEMDSRIYSGFNEPVDKETYLEAVRKGTLHELLKAEEAVPGDVFFTPAGRIHSIGAGITLAEIQQTSDITYRIFDWNRKDAEGNGRELHTDLATDAIDFNSAGTSRIRVSPVLNKTENLVNCEFFTTNLIHFNETIPKDYNLIDSFVIYLCLEGEFMIRWNGNSESVIKGETVLLPAMIRETDLVPSGEAKILEIFINEDIN
ncbi:MAG TPA: class I mannose-6-phosphate isomerase [Bacteroidales bacterium]|nr:class I mannose-6-phosphate isomerase [Bacteroidales bacterium]HPF03464.1 class I mannose-6-phosphate isomerase [Bacteroidales bacterium]HPJ60404.1 class I mannose-6-phosphate isomerase [Bacteroidales bacterium]HPR12736.1 class I mannose-6-phosphate isomerase [Bacteroidales bacterium]HRW85606.1 class I mannose-6-phosphate isomerase [Bacteroidales bacterium]